MKCNPAVRTFLQVCQHPNSRMREWGAEALTSLIKAGLTFNHEPPLSQNQVETGFNDRLHLSFYVRGISWYCSVSLLGWGRAWGTPAGLPSSPPKCWDFKVCATKPISKTEFWDGILFDLWAVDYFLMLTVLGWSSWKHFHDADWSEISWSSSPVCR